MSMYAEISYHISMIQEAAKGLDDKIALKSIENRLDNLWEFVAYLRDTDLRSRHEA